MQKAAAVGRAPGSHTYGRETGDIGLVGPGGGANYSLGRQPNVKSTASPPAGVPARSRHGTHTQRYHPGDPGFARPSGPLLPRQKPIQQDVNEQ